MPASSLRVTERDQQRRLLPNKGKKTSLPLVIFSCEQSPQTSLNLGICLDAQALNSYRPPAFFIWVK